MVVVMVLVAWVVLSIPVGLAVGAMFRAGSGRGEPAHRVAPALVPVRVTPRRPRGVRH